MIMAKKYGCIGKKLTHSFSKDIHARLADYKYDLIELNEEEIKPFFKEKGFEAINVTIPYKQTVIPYLDHISDIAQRIGAVNTIVNRDGVLYGYNTDYYGMKALIERVGVELSGKKVLILGTGGTSKTARVVANDMGASQILTVSRRKNDDCITYEEAISAHCDANIIINTTVFLFFIFITLYFLVISNIFNMFSSFCLINTLSNSSIWSYPIRW